MDKKRIYSMLVNESHGDLVYCTNCGETSLVKCGINICPICKAKGCNMWVNEDKQEYSIDEVASIANVEIVQLPEDRCLYIEAMDVVSQIIGD